MRLIDANAIPWEEYYVPDPDRNVQWDYKKELSVLKPVVDQMPTVDAVEVVHGHNTYDHNSAFGCSVCGFEDWDTNTADIQKYNYCPNCGAKMDGDTDNEKR